MLARKKPLLEIYTDETTLDQLLEGARAIYHICPSVDPDEATVGEMLIDASKSAGVERFVFHSVMHPQITALTHHAQKLIVEEKLIQSGLWFTILQPASYMQNVMDRTRGDNARGIPNNV